MSSVPWIHQNFFIRECNFIILNFLTNDFTRKSFQWTPRWFCRILPIRMVTAFLCQWGKINYHNLLVNIILQSISILKKTFTNLFIFLAEESHVVSVWVFDTIRWRKEYVRDVILNLIWNYENIKKNIETSI